MSESLVPVRGESMNVGRLRWNWSRALTTVGVMLLLLLALYWETAVSMAEIWWRSDTFAHGMLVVPIVVYMIWIRHRQLLGLTPRLQPAGLWLIAALTVLWLLAHLAGIQVVQQLALVALVPALVLTLLGRQVTWALAFPLGYLFFAVPMGEGLVPPLQDFTAWFTVRALQLTNIPVYWEGRLIQLPGGDFEVAEACSGMRYLIASLALGCLYAYLTYRSLWRRLAFIAFSAVVPIVANGLRAYGIVMLAHLSGHRLAVGVDHIIYGWVFFGLVVLVMFWVGSWWREPEPEDEDEQAPVMAGQGTVLARRGLLILPLALVLLVSGPLMVQALEGGKVSAALTLKAPAADAGWEGPLTPEQGWQPAFQGAAAQLHQAYRLGDRSVQLYMAYYPRQQQGAELINATNTLYQSKDWLFLGQGHRQVNLGDEAVELDTLQLGTTRQERLLIWHWYQVAGFHTTSAPVAKLLEVWGSLTGQGSAVIAVATLDDPGVDGELLARFLRDLGPEIIADLAQVE